jgi:C1A family cysteine protease
VAIDWAEAGKVGPVIDQGQCGASWAFSAIGAFESRHMIKDNNILGSAQELLDCTDTYGNFGCNGGYMSYSFKYIKEKHVHETKDYPYTGKSEKCKNTVAGTTWTLHSYTETTKCD